MMSRRIKTAFHRWLDPLLSWRSGREALRILADLPDGEYMVPFEVPYVSQFASPDLINDYIHHGYDGTQDPNWGDFGAPTPEDYAFWAPRVCALACLRMAIMAFDMGEPTLWQLVQRGLEFDGYRLRDEDGRWIDEGWYVQAQVKLAAKYGLQMVGYSYASPLEICQRIREGDLVAATVTPEIGERAPQTRRYAGHLVLVLGYRWRDGMVESYCLHNPSGRYPELRAYAWVSARRFKESYAFRYATLKKH